MMPFWSTTGTHDFPKLTERLVADFPERQRDAFVLSMNANSAKIIDEQIELLRGRVWFIAGISAAAANKIPGFAAVVWRRCSGANPDPGLHQNTDWMTGPSSDLPGSEGRAACDDA